MQCTLTPIGWLACQLGDQVCKVLNEAIIANAENEKYDSIIALFARLSGAVIIDVDGGKDTAQATTGTYSYGTQVWFGWTRNPLPIR